jgi:hypothetical protein
MSQAAKKSSNPAKESARGAGHIEVVRNVIGAQFPQALHPMETTMKSRITSTLRNTVRWALLPAIAMSAIIVALPAAKAADQQATTAEMDYDLSRRAVTEGFGNNSGAYAQTPHTFRPSFQRNEY